MKTTLSRLPLPARSAGVLLHISSLPSPYGIGTFGAAAYRFVDQLAAAGQKVWQILPLCPCGSGNSPYQGLSAFAGNPYFIDLDFLCAEGLLTHEELAALPTASRSDRVDYRLLELERMPLLIKAASRMEQSPAFGHFCEKNEAWLGDYALFMAIKEAKGNIGWDRFPEPLKLRRPQSISLAAEQYRDRVQNHKKLQFLFFTQWQELRRYAHKRSIRIIGDLPIYLAYDSADVWAHPEEFLLSRDRRPPLVAACPPDSFNRAGQLWGNPLYDWEHMKKDGYRFFLRRFSAAMDLYDTVRIDHFRGFQSYYAVPATARTASCGQWYLGPGKALFDAAEQELGPLPFIAEDLGHITPAVRTLLQQTDFPGMKILQFAFSSGENASHMPHRLVEKDVLYSGTHDNNTLRGWLKYAPEPQRTQVIRYLRLRWDEGYDVGALRTLWASPCHLAIAQMQDLLRLSGASRMNIPGTPFGNWEWRMKEGQFSPSLARRLRREMKLYRR